MEAGIGKGGLPAHPRVPLAWVQPAQPLRLLAGHGEQPSVGRGGRAAPGPCEGSGVQAVCWSLPSHGFPSVGR